MSFPKRLLPSCRASPTNTIRRWKLAGNASFAFPPSKGWPVPTVWKFFNFSHPTCRQRNSPQSVAAGAGLSRHSPGSSRQPITSNRVEPADVALSSLPDAFSDGTASSRVLPARLLHAPLRPPARRKGARNRTCLCVRTLLRANAACKGSLASRLPCSDLLTAASACFAPRPVLKSP